MSFTPTASDAWLAFGESKVYRYLDPGAPYRPDAPWPTSGGRFDDGTRATLYVADRAQGPVAEYLRRHPELLELQDSLRLELYSFTIRCASPGCDVRSDDQAAAVGISHEELTSSHREEHERYRSCRELADAVDDADGVGIASPSAAFEGGSNIVVFHNPANDWWIAEDVRSEAVPKVDPTRVRVIPG